MTTIIVHTRPDADTRCTFTVFTFSGKGATDVRTTRFLDQYVDSLQPTGPVLLVPEYAGGAR